MEREPATQPPIETAGQVSRRTVLKWGGVSAAGLILISRDLAGAQSVQLLAAPGDLPAARLVVRADDGLLLALSLINLGVQPASLGRGPQLALIDPAAPGFVVLGLQPQSVAEQAYFNAAAEPGGLVPAVVSGPSQLALKVAPGSPPRPYDLPTLLDLAAFPLAVSTVADSGSAGIPPRPLPTETAIEAPWRLFLSPPGTATFSAVRVPVTRNGRTELWHARAVRRREDGTADQRPLPVPVRAIWSPDLPGGTPLIEPPWATQDGSVALTQADRIELVAATTTPNAPAGTAGPAMAALLLVSPMGASLGIDGAWPQRSGVTAWKHRSWLGRDNYVKIDRSGFLFPFGFRATKLSITERVLLDGGRVAFLRKQEFVVVREPTIDFPGPGQPNSGRNLPFTRAQTTTLISPPLPAPTAREAVGSGFWVSGPTAADLLRYRLILTARDGGQVTADLPMIFVPEPDSFGDPTAFVNAFNNADAATRRTLRFGGQKLGFVPRAGASLEETALPTFDLVLMAEGAAAGSNQILMDSKRLNGYPLMDTAQVHLEVLDAVGGALPRTTIALAGEYTSNGLPTPPAPGAVAPSAVPANAGEVWAMIKPATPPTLSVPQQIGGGLAAPSLDVKGLSRAFGPVADPGNIANGVFKPDAYFPLDKITLLGGIPLKAVLDDTVAPIPDPRGPQGDGVPKVVTVRTGSTVDTTVTWKAALKRTKDDLFDPGTGNRLELKAMFHTDLTTGATSTTVTGDLRNVTLNFVGAEPSLLAFIQQKITRLHFESREGAKPTVDVQLGQSKFLGELAFLADLQDKLPALPGGIKIDQTPRGVSAGLSIAIPTVGVGVLVLQNLAIGVLLDLPFNGDQAVLIFNFATREHPFQLTVSALGGGGFLAVGIGTRGPQQIEGSLEFGAAVALDLGVASGSVSIMAGIYFKYAQKLDAAGNPRQPAGSTVVIAGFVRANGTLDVLGLIHVSIEFYLGLTFTARNKEAGILRAKVEGTATLSVRVEVLLFSESVELTMHKEFGAGPDPTFGQQITASDWAAYCAAFAAA